MRIPLAELLDRMAILKLKIENYNDPEVKREYAEYEKAVEEYEKEGIKVEKEWIDELYLHNKEFWNQVIALKEAEKKGDIAEMGRVYINQRIANKKRVAVKNKIGESTGSGFKDIKVN